MQSEPVSLHSVSCPGRARPGPCLSFQRRCIAEPQLPTLPPDPLWVTCHTCEYLDLPDDLHHQIVADCGGLQVDPGQRSTGMLMASSCQFRRLIEGPEEPGGGDGHLRSPGFLVGLSAFHTETHAQIRVRIVCARPEGACRSPPVATWLLPAPRRFVIWGACPMGKEKGPGPATDPGPTPWGLSILGCRAP